MEGTAPGLDRKDLTLPNGTDLVIECLEPPLLIEEIAAFDRLVNSALSEPFISELLRGSHAQDIYCRVVRGVSNNRLLGTGWMAWARSFPKLGVIAGVVTRSSHRRQGIASHICTTLCDVFEANGGAELYLGAASTTARRIYERLGFQEVAGRVMRRVAEEHESPVSLVPGLPVVPRPANWSDIARVVPLYAWPHECLMVESSIGYPSVLIEPPYRCVRIFWELWDATIARSGWWRVLENSGGWLVAGATARSDKESVQVDYIWHPAYAAEAREFLLDFTRSVEKESGLPCELVVCEEDDWKMRQANALGFTKTHPTDDAVDIAGKKHSLLAFRR